MMKKEVILELFGKFEQACYSYQNVEYWSARDMQHILGYLRWENFFNVVNKAKKACEIAGSNIDDHFRDATKMITIAKGGQRVVEDIALTRYACYLIAQNGDSAKQAIAFAQTYFAVQTRKQEIIEQRLIDVERVTAREKLTKSEKKLSGILYERGVDSAGFAIIRSKGDQALFGGFSTNDMKKKLGVPPAKPLADFLPTLTIKAKDFANELTSHNVIEKDLNNNTQISKEHIDNNKAVRDILLQRGVRPESLPPAEDVKKLGRRLESDEKKVSKTGGKPKK